MQPTHEIFTGGKVEATSKEVSPTLPSTEPVPDRGLVSERISAASAELRKLILEVKRLPRDKSLEPHLEEMRCLATAQTNLQTGLMWLRRAVNPTKEF